jgi:hypothetical protein
MQTGTIKAACFPHWAKFIPECFNWMRNVAENNGQAKIQIPFKQD